MAAPTVRQLGDGQRAMAFSDVVELGSTEFSKKYHVIAKLGEGGMAFVHLAVVRGVAGVRKLVVLKSIRPELLSVANVSDLFLAEARIAATLSHPNIVHSFEVIVSKKRPVLVMEYLDGQPFERVLRLADLPLPFALFALKETLRGLDYAHNVVDLEGRKLNLVHRDVSPQNIFVTYDGQIKLLDFGIAKVIGSTANTETGEIKGKVRYMAPEQMLGRAAVDARADVFSVGVMLWEAVTGRRLWDGMNDIQVIQAVTAGPVAAPSTVAPNVPARLEAICIRALAQSPDDRYDSAAAMLGDLDAAIEELGLRTDARRISKYVSDAFAELRASVKAVVEAQLRNHNAAPVRLIVSEGSTLIAEKALHEDLSAMPSTLTVGRAEARRRRREVVAYTGLFAAGAVILAFFSLLGGGTAREVKPAAAASAVVAEPTPRSTSSPSADDTSGRVPLDVHPAQATFLDSERRTVERAPLPAALPPKGPASPNARPIVSRSVGAPAASPNSGQAPPACTPPFLFDERGIKRFKPECLK
jgi:serine/threonine-protein kinase